ncbi:MAG: T9SS type A sorting domain-containing protein [Bacteroidota bacterium]
MQQDAKITASDRAQGDEFGHSVSLSGDRALVGAYFDDNRTGSAYVFAFDGTTWTEQAKLTASDGAEGDQFGWSVSLLGDRALISADRDDSFTGSAYVFAFDGTTWTEQAKLTASDGAEQDRFGSSVSLSGDRALIGAPVNATRPGSAYVFSFDGIAWAEQAKLTGDDRNRGELFGDSVSLSDNLALAGARLNDGNIGSAYAFAFDGTAWNRQALITANDRTARDFFGKSVFLLGNRALISAEGDDDLSGAVYVFVREGTEWNQQAKLVPSDRVQGGVFGTSVSLSSNRALIGAAFYDSAAGSAYVFTLSELVASEDDPMDGIALTVAPNPVAGRSSITFELSEAADVTASLYDALGREVTQLTDAPYAAGRHTIKLATVDLPVGVYVVRAQFGDTVRTARLTVVR